MNGDANLDLGERRSIFYVDGLSVWLPHVRRDSARERCLSGERRANDGHFYAGRGGHVGVVGS